MIRTLAWKEYREQRGLWLAIAVMGAILSVAVSSFARGGISQVANDSFVASFVIGLFITLMVAQGIVCGVQLLAGEKETGTLAFLDALSILRFPVWWTKVLVGLAFVLAQALVLFVIAQALNVGIRGHFVGFIVAGVFAYCWGLLGGALCDKVFAAIAAAIGLGIASYIAIPLVPIVGLIVFLVAPPIFVVLSARRFGTPDLQRGLYRGLLALRRPQEGPVGWMTLVWLAEKQGRWILWPGLLVSFLAGFVSFLPPDLLWLSATLIIGLVCGGAVFGPEQAGEQDRFLGAQRLPPGQVWFVKTLFWMLAAVGMTCLLGLAMVWRLKNRDPHGEPPDLFLQDLARQNIALFLTLAIIHGFCIGQFCSFLSRKAVVVGFLGAAISLIFFVLWLPSLVFGGVHAWQILGVPLLLLIAARLSMWPWYSGRMYTRRHFVGLAACLACVAVWLSGSIWCRVWEVPDVGEPFDVSAFEAKLEKAKYSPAVPLIRKGILAMESRMKKIEADSGPFTKALFPELAKMDNPNAPGAMNLDGNSEIPKDLLFACIQVRDAGKWPANDVEFGPRLDELFAGEWGRDLHNAARMPLGLNKNEDREFSGITLYPARILQLQARNDYLGALEDLETSFGLARQWQNCNADIKFDLKNQTHYYGLLTEHTALRSIDEWLNAAGPRPDLLQKALTLLQDHEKESPDPLDNIKADYWVLKQSINKTVIPGYVSWWVSKSVGRPDSVLSKMSVECIWEVERRLRILNALYVGQLRLAKLTPTQWSKTEKQGEQGEQAKVGLPWRTGLQFDRLSSAKDWANLLRTSGFQNDYLLPDWPHDMPRYLRYVRFRQVAIGLMLYQAEEGHAAAKLADLVPRFLPTLPLDPWLNEPFDYRLSQGEEIEDESTPFEEAKKIKLAAGQGFLRMKSGRNLFPGFATAEVLWLPSYFAVPVWSKEKE